MMTFWAQGSQGRGMPGIGTLRARYAALFQRFGAVPGDLSYVPDFLGPVRGEWVGTPDPAAAILYFHGGGGVDLDGGGVAVGSQANGDRDCQWLCGRFGGYYAGCGFC